MPMSFLINRLKNAKRVSVANRKAPGTLAAVVWGLVFFAGLQLAMAVVFERNPELSNPHVGHPLIRLRGRLQETPSRPLLLMLGSSRTQTGFRPQVLPPLTVDSNAPILFNFGISGSGPITELFCLNELLCHGIRPRWLLVEVLAPLLHQDGQKREEAWCTFEHLPLHDRRLQSGYFARRRASLACCWETPLLPVYTHRTDIMGYVAPDWVPLNLRRDYFRAADAGGWLPAFAKIRADQFGPALEHARREYQQHLEAFQISPEPGNALRQLLGLCARRDITPVLVLMPEGSTFRSWYPPKALAELDAYLASLSRQYGVPVVDARRWMPDSAFVDSHHLQAGAADAFTRRLGREVLGPLVQGEPLPAHALLGQTRQDAEAAPSDRALAANSDG
jgi:hypothetical protein